MKLNVYGRMLEILWENEQWAVFSLGEGKKRQETLIVIPADMSDRGAWVANPLSYDDPLEHAVVLLGLAVYRIDSCNAFLGFS